MGKVRPQQAKAPRREPTPPSSSEEEDGEDYFMDEEDHSHGSDCGSECEDGSTLIPALDIAILARLQESEKLRLSNVANQFASRYIKLIQDYTEEQARFVREDVQSHVVALARQIYPSVKALRARIVEPVADDEEAMYQRMEEVQTLAESYYGNMFVDAMTKGTTFERRATLRLRITTLAMSFDQKKKKVLQRGGSGTSETVFNEQWFSMTDPLHYPQTTLEDLTDFWCYVTAVTPRYITPEECGAANLPVACIGLEFTFSFMDFSDEVSSTRSFKNNDLRVIFLFAGTRVERLGILHPGRLVAILSETAAMRDEKAPRPDDHGFFSLFFSGLLPSYEKQGAGPSPAIWQEVSKIGQIAQRVLGTTAGMIPKAMTPVDIEVLHRVMEQFFVSNPKGTALSSPIFPTNNNNNNNNNNENNDKDKKKKNKKRSRDDQDEDLEGQQGILPEDMASPPITRLSECITSIRNLAKTVTLAVDSAPITQTELDITRRIILLHEAYNSIALDSLWNIAVGPVELAVSRMGAGEPEDDEESEEDEEFEEGDEEFEEFEDEEYSEEDEEEEQERNVHLSNVKPPSVVVAKKSANMKGQPPPPRPGSKDCKQQ